jgi:hypothetical protein
VAAIRRALRGRLERLVAQRQQLEDAQRRLRHHIEDVGADYAKLERPIINGEFRGWGGGAI